MKDDQKEVVIQNSSTRFAILQSIQSQGPIQYLVYRHKRGCW